MRTPRRRGCHLGRINRCQWRAADITSASDRKQDLLIGLIRAAIYDKPRRSGVCVGIVDGAALRLWNGNKMPGNYDFDKGVARCFRPSGTPVNQY